MSLRVSVAIAWPTHQDVIEVDLAEGSTVADAIAAADLARRYPDVDLSQVRTGIWSRPCAPGTRLRDGDRIELYRPLIADAKQMRRSRARRRP